MRWVLRVCCVLGVSLFGIPVTAAVAGATSSITVSGTVECNSGALKGVWVESSGGGSGFASWTAFAIDKRAGWYTRTISATPTSVRLHVGCGGPGNTWASTSYTPTRAIRSSQTLNTWCTVSTKSSAKPNMGKTSQTVHQGDRGNCTWYAMQRFHDYEAWGSQVSWPYLTVPRGSTGDAYQWAALATATNPPWSVRTVPEVNSIVVFPRGSGYGTLGHVAWVESISRDGKTLNVREMNYPGGTPKGGPNKVDARSVPEATSYRFIVAPWLPAFADINRDEKIDILDLSILESHYGGAAVPAWTQGDLNGDGHVTILDMSILLTNWGQ